MVVKSFFLFFNMREIHGPQVMLCNQRERVGGMGIRASHVCETLIKTAAEASWITVILTQRDRKIGLGSFDQISFFDFCVSPLVSPLGSSVHSLCHSHSEELLLTVAIIWRRGCSWKCSHSTSDPFNLGTCFEVSSAVWDGDVVLCSGVCNNGVLSFMPQADRILGMWRMVEHAISEFSLVEDQCRTEDMLHCEASILFTDAGSTRT